MRDDRNASNSAAAVGGGAAHDRRDKAIKVAGHELKRFLVMFLYLWVLFGLFVLYETVVLRERGVHFAPHGFAFFNALVLAKVMLIAEDLNLGGRLQPRPLIYPIVQESFLLTVLFIVVHVVEKVVIGLIHGEDLSASVPSIGGGGIEGLLCVAMILFVSLIPFFAFRRVSRELGPGRLRAMMLGGGDAS
jgi:hypothetical protein